ncbi:hypothetical protein BAG01nite_48950 [Brevibacillus agri]|uniref:DNA phosphorothioation-dependent restriction protein DptF n=1 Tax=Brevibacillus agri TaxID=51101 RepID=A0A3M8A2E0_9BACL|nr:DNA phosphorothioation-dependent restriction protein DptF [Brevibacillus agri]QAV15156.1 DNA phosphorothioation-dependent restriction protein DptF [Brevibacillus agri]RNB45390.1 DNA phosphorothioation-dependent restriction protein DptF [Brevibacillus agri]GED28793.1 hypothetical protein BAG01nite_48950 [Brevibacillus agri]
MPDQYFLSFIEHISDVAAHTAKKMEELIYEDPSSAIIKARLFAEEIVNEVFKQENLDVPYASTFYDKISFLSKEGFIRREIQSAFDTIRITGNKAAHNGAFNDITETFKLHKTMYNIAVWFYEVYSKEQLRIPLYEHPKPAKSALIDIDEIKKQIMNDLVNREELAKGKSNEGQAVTNNLLELPQDLAPGESYLARQLRRLQDSSKEAIENANTFSDFKKYLHVERKIQLDFEWILQKNKGLSKPNLILLCGSVGDGKSHLLAYLKEHKPELLEGYQIFNDATESFSPSKNAMETLAEVLHDFSDQGIGQTPKKVILAINMGVLHNFITTEHQNVTFEAFRKFIDDSELFSQNVTISFSSEYFDLISFGDYHEYELTNEGATSQFYLSLLKKIFGKTEDNPFYLSYTKDLARNNRTMAHDNYEFMQAEFVQEQIVNLIIQAIVKAKNVISTRAFLNFIADIVMPDQNSKSAELTDMERIQCSVPSLLFTKKERSPILKSIFDLDPIHIRSQYIDNIIIYLNTTNEGFRNIDEYVSSPKGKEWIAPFLQEDRLSDYTVTQLSMSIIRLAFLTNPVFASYLEDDSYTTFMKHLYGFNTGNKSSIREVYDNVKEAVFKWRGSPKRDYVYLNKPNETYRLAQKLNIRPVIDHLKPIQKDILQSFKSTLLVCYTKGDGESKAYLDIDYPLYQLLERVRQGYCPNKKDEEDATKFVEFIDKMMHFGDKNNELLIHFPSDARFYHLRRDDFASFVFERENS